MHENIITMQMWCNAWSFKQHFDKTHPKNWAKTSLILENLKTFQKSQKLGQKHEMHDEERD